MTKNSEIYGNNLLQKKNKILNINFCAIIEYQDNKVLRKFGKQT